MNPTSRTSSDYGVIKAVIEKIKSKYTSAGYGPDAFNTCKMHVVDRVTAMGPGNASQLRHMSNLLEGFD